MRSAMLLLLFSANLASAYLSCYSDSTIYSNYQYPSNEKPVQCSDSTIFCFSKTTTNVGSATHHANCDSNNTICVGSGCWTLGNTETCCCTTNYCNTGSGYSVVIPMIFFVLSYAFLK